MLSARWYKVFNDLWGNKTRTVLIVLSIAVGLFALGMSVISLIILPEEMDKGYAAINPSSGTVNTYEPFDEDLIRSVRRMKEVQDADGRWYFPVRLQVRPGDWRNIHLFAVSDYDQMRVSKIRPQSGAWPPPKHELLIERAAMGLMGGAKVGDVVLIETPARLVRELRVAGLVHDLAQVPAPVNGAPYGYISFDTLEWLGAPRGFNQLHFIIAENKAGKQEAQRVVNLVKDKVEKSGRTIVVSQIVEPGELPLNNVLKTILLLLGVLGFLSLLLSAFLIVNTISALVTQQVRQVGVMKAVGAHAGQIMGMYLALVLIYGLLALIIAVPLGALGARALCRFLAGFFNFDLTSFYVPFQAVALQVTVGLLVPVLAALYPIVAGLRTTAAEAMSTFGLGQGQFGTGWLDRLLAGANSAFALRVFSRPLLLSLRNTFRRKGRLALTLVTLTLAGAIFISVFSVRASMSRTLDDAIRLYQFDVEADFTRPRRVERIERETLRVPGVVRALTWIQMPARRVRPDANESGTIFLFAPPNDPDLFHPVIVQGRWLLSEDDNAVVINTNVLKDEPDVRVGGDIVLKIEDRKMTFRVVGIIPGLAFPMVFANYSYIARLTQSAGQATGVLATTERHDAQSQAQTAVALEAHLKQVGLRVNSVFGIEEELGKAKAIFNSVLALLLVMAVLLAIVGGLGLMGTMSINVLERTREIGVMRAIGAADGSVAQVFIVEGVVIGVISWLLGTPLAFPVSKWLSDAVGMTFFYWPLSYVFSTSGALLWLVVVVVLAALASFLPAWNASRLTVRDVLAYE